MLARHIGTRARRDGALIRRFSLVPENVRGEPSFIERIRLAKRATEVHAVVAESLGIPKQARTSRRIAAAAAARLAELSGDAVRKDLSGQDPGAAA